MQYTPHQLKEKLLEGLDEDNNVVDMGGVLHVISILENFPITREALEQTRIGKFVNELRRKTSNDQLAKRAKRLVRHWQKVVNETEAPPTVNGDRISSVESGGPPGQRTPISPAIQSSAGRKPISPAVSRLHANSTPGSPAVRPHTPNSVHSSLSPRKSNSKPSTPALPQLAQVKNSLQVQKNSKRSASSPQLSLLNAKRQCLSPSVESRPGTPDSVSSHSSRKSVRQQEHLNNASPDNGPLASSDVGSQFSNKARKTATKDRMPNSSASSPALTSSDSSIKISSKNDQNGIISNLKSRNGDHSSRQTIGYKSDAKYKHMVNGMDTSASSVDSRRVISPSSRSEISPTSVCSSHSNNSISVRKSANVTVKTEPEFSLKDRTVSLTPKVKNTAQLIQSLKEKNNSFSFGNAVCFQIQTNQIEREPDIPQSVVPEGALPRARKKGDLAPPTSNFLSKTKTEMVEKFLQTAVTESAAQDLSPLKYEMSRAESPGTASTSFDDSIHEKDATTSSLVQRNLSSVSELRKRNKTLGKSVMKQEIGEDRSKVKPDIRQPSLSLEEIYSRYPPLDIENFEFDIDQYDVPEPVEVTDNVVERLHLDHWEGVNGCTDSRGVWHDWTQTLSYGSDVSELVHVLPYVVIDD